MLVRLEYARDAISRAALREQIRDVIAEVRRARVARRRADTAPACCHRPSDRE